MTVLERPAAAAEVVLHRPSIAPLAVGGAGMLVAFAFSWVPSLWFDEAATVSAATRTIPQLIHMLSTVDLVHGLYYFAMHFWFDLVGYSPVSLRLPSAVAVGVAAALIVVLVRGRAPERVAVLAGILFVLLPRVTWAGTEGRSYAATALLAVVLGLAYLRASRSTTRRWWIVYGVIAAISCLGFLYLALLVVAQGVTAALTSRRVAFRWLIASAGAAIVLSPFVLAAGAQTGQVSWISPITAQTWHGVFVAQWFYGNNWLAIVGWGFIVLGVVALRRRRDTLLLLLPWLVLPTVLLVLVSIGMSPLYSARYLTFCAPAAAILMAYGVDALRRRWLVGVALAACAALTLPSYLQQRGPSAKDGTAWNQVATLVADHGVAGEGIVWGPLADHLVASSRVIRYSYPEDFTDAVDVTLNRPANRSGKLWESSYDLGQVPDRLAGLDVVWVITGVDPAWEAATTRTLVQQGYALTDQWTIGGTVVQRYEG